MIIDNMSVLFRYLIIAQVVFVLTYLLFYKQRKNSVLFFGLFLISYCAPNLIYILNSGTLVASFPNIRFIPIGFYFTCMPLFYLYTKSLIGEVKRKEIILYMIPALLDFILLLVLFLIPYEQSSEFRKNNYWFFVLWHTFILNTFSLFFIYLTLKKIQNYQNKYLNFFSNTQKINLNWIKMLGYLLVFIYLFQLSAVLFDIKDVNNVIYLVDSILSLIVIYWISIFGIKQPHIAADFEVFEHTKVVVNSEVQDYEKIVSVLNKSGIYKNPNLTIIELAENVGLSPKKVSQTINEYANKNFNHFINEFRIKEAKILLIDPNYKNLTIEAVFKDSGFNSKSVFNTIFKETTGTTPSSYKKSCSILNN